MADDRDKRAQARPGERVHHTVGFEHVARELDVDLTRGLTSFEADARLSRYGPNALHEEKPKSVFEMLLEQFRDFLVLILIASTFIAASLGELLDAGVILAIVILNAIMGLVHERRAEPSSGGPLGTGPRDGLCGTYRPCPTPSWWSP